MTIIPQNVEQALQRDQQQQHATLIVRTAELDLADLRNAVLEHHATIEAAGTLGRARELSAAQRRIMQAKHDADEALWAHVLPPDPAEPEPDS